MAFVDSVIVFAVSLGIGSIGIHLGALLVIGKSDYRDAMIAALIGAIIWSLVGFFIGWIPLLGPLLTLAAWLGVINALYSGGWVKSVAVALIAWITAVVILTVLASLGLGNFEAIGIPGV